MNLKKIIKENLDDLQWIKDIVGQTFNIGDTVICKPGFGKVWGKWEYGGSGYKEGKIFTIRDISPDGEVLWPEPEDDPYGVYTKAVELYSEEKMVKENNDLDWIREIPDYQLPKNKKDLQQFVGWYFLWDKSNDKSGEWAYDGKRWLIKKIDLHEIWYIDEDLEGQTNESVEGISNFLRRIQDGIWVLLSPNNFLLDPWGREYNGRKPIEEKNNINESEDDGLDWIKDIGPKDMTFRVGDIIKVHNVGDEDAFLSWLGDYSDDYVEGNLGENITGEIEEITVNRISIFVSNIQETIFFPTYSDLEFLRSNHEDFNGLDMYYEIIE
jgi:hypothetical protein